MSTPQEAVASRRRFVSLAIKAFAVSVPVVAAIAVASQPKQAEARLFRRRRTVRSSGCSTCSI